MKRVTFKILFVVKKTRVAKNGEAPVMLRITINGVRAETSTNMKVNPDDWNSVAEKSFGKTPKDEELNLRIDTVRVKIMKIYREMELDGTEITAQKIIDRYLGRDMKPNVMLLDLFREHNERYRKLSESAISPATLERYVITLKHTADFIRFNYHADDIPVVDVTAKFILDFEFYLRTECKCCNNTAVKYIKNFKKIIRIALTNGDLKVDPFINLKFKKEEVDPEFLEEEELQVIINKEITVERLAMVRDTFVFCCFTGLAFSDVKQLTAEHLVRDNNGALWIRKKRQKTKNMCNIPLLVVPRKILERYKDHPNCIKQGTLLPVPSNQKMNAYLKEIAVLCHIKKELTSHTGRHTFATSVALANNVSMENVAKMLGHSDTKMTRHYARILDKSIMRDMKLVDDRFKSLL